MGNRRPEKEQKYLEIGCKIYRGVEQLVARWAHNPKVTGSSPVPATKIEGFQKWKSFLFNKIF